MFPENLVIARAEGASFDVRVVPGASRCAVILHEGGLRVRIDAPPVDGAANERLLRYLAKEVFDVPVRAVSLIRGERGRNKTIGVSLGCEIVRDRLAAAIQSR